MRLLGIGAVALLVGWLLFALTSGIPVVGFILIFIQETLSFAVGSRPSSCRPFARRPAPRHWPAVSR
jgi:DHA1 family chloramphenicol resistance protein-like MFS transporter